MASSSEEDKVPPVPQHTPPRIGDSAGDLMTLIARPWADWFDRVRVKINLINQSLANLSSISGSGFLVKLGGNWFLRTIQGTIGQIDITNGDGTLDNPTISLSDLSDSGIGESPVKLFTRDNKGRVAGTQDATTDDLPQGVDNLYFTSGSAQDAVVVQTITDGDVDHSPSGDVIYDALSLKVNSSLLGVPNGVSTLDGAGKVPVTQLPNSIMEYKGTWDASTNIPTLVDGVGNTGDVYRVSVAGTQNLGSGPITFGIGDYIIYNGTIWEKADTTDAVYSVFGRMGAVIATIGDYAADQVTNIPSGGISSTTVQAALNELDTEKQSALASSTSNTISGNQVQRAALTGDVTAPANSNVTTIANNAVTLAKMANLVANTLIGNNTGSSTTPIALTRAQVLAFLDLVFSDIGGTPPTWNQDTTGNAATATQLETSRTFSLSGVTATSQSFDGSSNVNILITAIPASLLTGAVSATSLTSTGVGSSITATGSGGMLARMLAGSSTVVFGTSIPGTVAFRPNGTGSTTGQATLTSAGLFTAPSIATPGTASLTGLASSPSYLTDALAEAGGVARGQLYRNGSIVQVRVT